MTRSADKFMPKASEHRPATASEVATAIDSFIFGHQHSNDLALRWLAHHLAGTLATIRDACGKPPSKETRRKMNALRADEINEVIRRNTIERERLERELRDVLSPKDDD